MRKFICRLRLNEVSRQQRRRPEPPPDASYTIPRIGSIKLTKLTAHDLQKLYKELMESGRTRGKSGHGNPGLSSTTVRSLHLMLHNALNRAVKERLILRNPTEDRIAPKVQKLEMRSSNRSISRPTSTPRIRGDCCPCFIWNWSADCARVS